MDTTPTQVDQPAPIRRGEQLDLGSLENYVRDRLPRASGAMAVAQFPHGHSNLTYLLRFGDDEYVLRRPPFGNVVQSAHDMGREYRVLSCLCQVYPPAPRPWMWCEDETVIGAPFYVMERRSGVVLRQAQIPSVLREDPQLNRRLAEAFVDNLVRLHTLDCASIGLGDLGRPTGYIQRQVTGWARRYQQARTEDVPDMEHLARWLDENRPDEGPPALIHNDYKYDNLILDPNDLPRIVAVLDWEMTTVGDPLMDLGTVLSYWAQADDPPADRETAFGPTMLPGSLTRNELVSRYAEQADINRPAILFYYSFGLFKLAVIIQQIYARFQRGHTVDARFANLNQRVRVLSSTGVRAIASGRI